jgi:hypothetical protein
MQSLNFTQANAPTLCSYGLEYQGTMIASFYSLLVSGNVPMTHCPTVTTAVILELSTFLLLSILRPCSKIPDIAIEIGLEWFTKLLNESI